MLSGHGNAGGYMSKDAIEEYAAGLKTDYNVVVIFQVPRFFVYKCPLLRSVVCTS